ncbi:MAG: HD domain-containing protein [Flavobacteriales bacterium]|nr:HD domain-containing protein [Flavobacteriales bacterium]
MLSVSKIFNDPVYGFITVSDRLILQLIDHPYFQRLSRISQVGLSHFVYPGAHHTRFHHALGALHLMQQALDGLRAKGITITEDEYRSAQIAILLHDIGHGPFSHTLENTILEGVDHESLSLEIMKLLNVQYHSELEQAIAIFTGTYHKRFLHQLVSSQLDIDRLDYLMRDSFYTGVAEGIIGSERIIKMMQVENDQLVIEEKGIYSLEKFLIARRLMYWQVYLHKTVLAAELLLTLIMQRAKSLAAEGKKLFCTSALQKFLYPSSVSTLNQSAMIEEFTRLDDFDVLASIKEWCNENDRVLSDLCKRLIQRRLFKAVWWNEEPDKQTMQRIVQTISSYYGLDDNEACYYLRSERIVQLPYDSSKGEIMIRLKNGSLKTIFEASDNLSRENLSRPVVKYIVCYPKEIQLEISKN